MQHPKSYSPEIDAMMQEKEVGATQNHFKHSKIPYIRQGMPAGAYQGKPIKSEACRRYKKITAIIDEHEAEYPSGKHWEKQGKQHLP